MPEESKAKSDPATRQKKLYKRGAVTNGLASVLLLSVGYGLGLGFYAQLAVIIQLLVFLCHGLPQSSEKFYDLSGSFTHFALVAASVMADGTKLRTPRQLGLALASVVWMTRLGSFLFIRISRDGKDGRFDQLKENWFAFMGAWALQATWVLLIQLPVILLNSQDDSVPLSNVDYLAAVLWFVGFFVEVIADFQKFQFRGDVANKEKYITHGLWSYSRHPNYFGEILMWSALALTVSNVGIATGDTRLHGAWVSPLFTALLLLKVSGVPMVEKAGAKKWGDDKAYNAYMSGTSMLIPWFPAKKNVD